MDEKDINAHGVSMIEIQKGIKEIDGKLEIVNFGFSWRITGVSRTVLNGQVAGSLYVQTKYSLDGLHGRGPLNNRAKGFTPRDTYLTHEEN